MIAEGKVGPQVLGDGAVTALRLNRDGALAVQCIHGDFFEAAYRNQQWTACTLPAGVAPGTVLSTTPPLTLWNPPVSGKCLVIIKAFMGYISGTLGAGTVNWIQSAVAGNQPAQPTTGTVLVARSNYIGNAAASVGVAQQGATVATTPVCFRPCWTFGAMVISTAVQPVQVVELTDGDILVGPGNFVGLHAIAAVGTSPLIQYSVTWEECSV